MSMKMRTKTLLMAAAFAAATSAMSSQAADYFAVQRQITDGYYPQYDGQSAPSLAKPETLHQAQENRWFELERMRGSGNGVADIPFPPPPAPVASAPSRPGTAYDNAENKWLDQERNETDGNVAPVPFPAPDATASDY
jgi:hypothetical protein